MKNDFIYYFKLFIQNFGFAISPFIGMIYTLIVIPILSKSSIEYTSGFGLYISISTMILFSFSGMTPSIIKYNKSGISLERLKFIIVSWASCICSFVFFLFLITDFLISDGEFDILSGYFFVLSPIILLSIVNNYFNCVLVINKRGSEVFKVSVLVMVVQFLVFLFVYVVLNDVFLSLTLPLILSSILNYFILNSKTRDIVSKNNSERGGRFFAIIKDIHLNSLDAVVISITFTIVVWLSSQISEASIIISTMTITILRLTILPLKRFGIAYASQINTLDLVGKEKFILNTLIVKYIYLLLLLPIVLYIFTVTIYNTGYDNVMYIFIIIALQMLIEPIASYVTSISKYLGFGKLNLKYTIIYQWFFCLPIIGVLLFKQILTVELLWGVMFFGRLIFSLLYLNLLLNFKHNKKLALLHGGGSD
ncbi:hypothetical protein [Vibrio parahaemolyticus]|uniref:hypothetical protein n=3 Tax=Vibrio parahaemolyticus TaxID=670 RepID=UPI0006B29CBE|nr:hypothetical protein [Vibrio parahaemolyticus]KOY33258.1 hypothetical protein ACX08_14075 [Vibrio parahaemolyticus]